MAAPLTWHLDILPADQRALWDRKLQAGFPGWVLYGGTALALRLGHRTSVDFDFFSAEPLVPLEFRERHSLDGDILQADANTLSVLHRGVKLSFFGGLSLGVLHAPDMLGNCPLASLDDLAACKLAALVNRVEPSISPRCCATGATCLICWPAPTPSTAESFPSPPASKVSPGSTTRPLLSCRQKTATSSSKHRLPSIKSLKSLSPRAESDNPLEPRPSLGRQSTKSKRQAADGRR